MALQSFSEIEPVSPTVRHHPSAGLHGQRPSVRPELVRRGEKCCLLRKSSLTGRLRHRAETAPPQSHFLLHTYLNIDVKKLGISISM